MLRGVVRLYSSFLYSRFDSNLYSNRRDTAYTAVTPCPAHPVAVYSVYSVYRRCIVYSIQPIQYTALYTPPLGWRWEGCIHVYKYEFQRLATPVLGPRQVS